MYMEEVAIAGKTIEVYKYFSVSQLKSKKCSRINKNITTEEEKERFSKINERNALKKLRLLINANFGENDIHLVLTYEKSKRPKDSKEAKKNLEKFMRKLRGLYKDNGLELKYICVTEYENKAIHHHLVINSIDTRKVVKLWEYGRPNVKYLDNTGDYKQLAEYLIKETRKTFRDKVAVLKQRWSSSKNLKKPIIKKRVLKRNTWLKEPKPKKGYYIIKDSLINGIHDWNGYEQPFQFYRMLRL